MTNTHEDPRQEEIKMAFEILEGMANHLRKQANPKYLEMNARIVSEIEACIIKAKNEINKEGFVTKKTYEEMVELMDRYDSD